MRRLVLKSYDCVVFVSSVIFYFLFMSCVSVFSLLNGSVLFGCGEGAGRESRRVSVTVTGGRV